MTNEILSSWIFRLAVANGKGLLRLHDFCYEVLECEEDIWKRDIDLHPTDALIDLLSVETGQSIHRLQSLPLTSYEGQLYEAVAKSGGTPWILPVGVLQKQRTRFGMQFCPLCLRGDEQPYFRKSWRVAAFVVCPIHRCVMMERCPICGAGIAFHRHGIGKRLANDMTLLRKCWACDFDLSSSDPGFEVQWNAKPG